MCRYRMTSKREERKRLACENNRKIWNKSRKIEIVKGNRLKKGDGAEF